MSELTVEVVKIGKVGTHPNANNLSITSVYKYPVIFRTGEFQPGDIAVYFPVESMVPDKEQYKFLWKERETPRDKDRIIKALKLRGIFSMGLLIPAARFPELVGSNVGDNVAQILSVTKYEGDEQVSLGGNNEKRPIWFPRYTDIENIRKYHEAFIPGETVILTEKIHGSNAGFAFHDNRLWISSRNLVKQLEGNTIWNKLAKDFELEQKLAKFPGHIIYGEAYGKVQKGFNYGLGGKSSLILFDIYNIDKGRYLDYSDFLAMSAEIGLTTVPILHKGPWENLEAIEALSDGSSIVASMGGENHIREGFVIRPEKERFHGNLGRVILKMHGMSFLLNK